MKIDCPMEQNVPHQSCHDSDIYANQSETEKSGFSINGAFTLPDTETDTETDTDADKLTLNPMETCIGLCFCAVRTPPHNSIQPIFIRLFIGLGVGQYEHTIIS